VQHKCFSFETAVYFICIYFKSSILCKFSKKADKIMNVYNCSPIIEHKQMRL